MKRLLPLVARLFLGLIFTVIGLNGFLHFLPMPPPPPAAGAFFGALAQTGYFIPLLKGTEVLAGLALLSGRFVPLALVVLAPIVVNIAAYHIFLTPGDLGMAAFLTFLQAFLAWTYRDSFRGVLDPDARPTT
jgi:uncharacterized membrane protein YphA (DoxX/SURF4 family)